MIYEIDGVPVELETELLLTTKAGIIRENSSVLVDWNGLKLYVKPDDTLTRWWGSVEIDGEEWIVYNFATVEPTFSSGSYEFDQTGSEQ